MPRAPPSREYSGRPASELSDQRSKAAKAYEANVLRELHQRTRGTLTMIGGNDMNGLDRTPRLPESPSTA